MSTYTPIASLTLTAATSSITFAGIPQTYTDLVVVVNATNSSGGDNAVALRFNDDTGSNYSMTRISGDGTSASSERSSNITLMYLGLSNSTVYNSEIYHIMNYSNTTTNKTVLGRGNVANSRVRASVGLWRNTAAITSVTVINDASVNFASGSTFNLYGISSNDSVTPKATGGNQVYSDGTNWYHIFTSSGTFTPTQALTADYVVVAGGGGGGRRWDENLRGGGGGGAGGFRTSTDSSTLSLIVQAYAVTVGAGGAGGNTGNPGNGYKGSNSVLSTISATGGGYGGGFLNSGGTGGSAGGHGRDRTVAGTAGNEGGYTPVEGYAGGRAEQGGNGTGCGGGGGAGAVGANGNSSAAGNGGIGRSNTITNGALFGQLSGGNYYLAGGGGGTYSTGGTQGTGGLGGGGAGAPTETGDGVAGTASTGGGGGGGGGGVANATGRGGNGASGVVIVRYAV